MAHRSDRRERIRQPDGYAKKTGDCGDTVEIFLTVRHNCIQSLAYDMNGCIHTNACLNAVATLVEGSRVEDAWELTPEDVIAYLETLPAEKHHCAELVVGALYLALADCRDCRRDPWRKLYR
jgi:nitrogen fixation NifU-like protein